jgi:hypothetical protein
MDKNDPMLALVQSAIDARRPESRELARPRHPRRLGLTAVFRPGLATRIVAPPAAC